MNDMADIGDSDSPILWVAKSWQAFTNRAAKHLRDRGEILKTDWESFVAVHDAPGPYQLRASIAAALEIGHNLNVSTPEEFSVVVTSVLRRSFMHAVEGSLRGRIREKAGGHWLKR